MIFSAFQAPVRDVGYVNCQDVVRSTQVSSNGQLLRPISKDDVTIELSENALKLLKLLNNYRDTVAFKGEQLGLKLIKFHIPFPYSLGGHASYMSLPPAFYIPSARQRTNV